ncbi:hypothetical protein CISIN_1g0199312mg, partial [Citrus sinensis]
MENSSLWDKWVEEALSKLEALKVLRSLRPIYLSPNDRHHRVRNPGHVGEDYEVFDEMQHWDRNAVQISISDSTFQRWLHDVPSSGDENEIICGDGLANDKTITFARQFKRLLLFSGNDYLGLSSHPTIAKAAAR